MEIKLSLVAFFLMLSSTLICADTVYLKNGKVAVGTIVETENEFIVIQTNQEEVEIPKEDIVKVEFTDRFTEQQGRTFALAIRSPGETFWRLLNRHIFISLQGQIALTHRFAINTIGTTGSLEDGYFGQLQMGFQYRRYGKFLDGFFWGLYPGIGYRSDLIDSNYNDSSLYFILIFEHGHQWIGKSGRFTCLSGGIQFLSQSLYYSYDLFFPYISVQVGYAFKNKHKRER